MKLVHLLSVFCFVLMLTGCKSYENSVAMMGIKNRTLAADVAADIDYDSARKVEGVAIRKVCFGFSYVKGGNRLLETSNNYKWFGGDKRTALYYAKKSSDADIILEPQFEIEKHKYLFGLFGSKITKVTGWGVNLKGLKENVATPTTINVYNPK